MTPEMGPSPYDAAIEDLEARIRNLQITLETLRQLRTHGDTGTPTMSSLESEVQSDSFFGMTIGEAAKKYLSMVKATKSTAEIALALERGGLKHSSKDFHATVRSMLGPASDFLRVPNGNWGLADWYRGTGRGKKIKAERPAKRKGGKRKKTTGETIEQRILNLMKTEPNRDWLSSEVSTALQAKRESVQSIMSHLVKEGQLTKAEKGYRHAKPSIVAA